MSVIAIHGEQVTKSRQRLVELIDQAKNNHQEVIHLSAKNLTEAELETQLGSASLFDQPQLFVIEELHSLPVSARRKALIALISQANQNLLLWEKKSLSKTQLKTLKVTQDFEFKTSSAVFRWLDSFSPVAATKGHQIELLQAACASESAEMCFILLIRQLRLLIQAKTGSPIAGPPFVVNKISGQARAFSLEQLLALHTQLLEMDQHQKTGQLWGSLRDELDLLILKL